MMGDSNNGFYYPWLHDSPNPWNEGPDQAKVNSSRFFDTAAWKEHQFTLYAIGFFMAYIGLYIPFFHVQVYCQEKLIIADELNIYLLPIMNAAGTFG
jgi:hypothetical protein